MNRYHKFLAALVMNIVSASVAARAQTASLDLILPAVERQIPGTMLDARGPLPTSDGKRHYEIKWLTQDGRVFWLSADATTGKISG